MTDPFPFWDARLAPTLSRIWSELAAELAKDPETARGQTALVLHAERLGYNRATARSVLADASRAGMLQRFGRSRNYRYRITELGMLRSTPEPSTASTETVK